jgi:hypothetical protein
MTVSNLYFTSNDVCQVGGIPAGGRKGKDVRERHTHRI